MKNVYATALVENILAGVSPETALANLKMLLQSRGHSRLWSQILKTAKRELVNKLERTSPQVVVADADHKHLDVAIKEALTLLGATDESYLVKIDKTLGGGFSLRVRGQLIDKSYKRTLINLYEKITK